MTTAQKIIKYLALAFACFLILHIFAGILFAIYTVGSIFERATTKETNIDGMREISEHISPDQISALKITVEFANLEIKAGETFKVETNCSDISLREKNGQLVIAEDGVGILAKNRGWVAVSVPEKMPPFREVIIETGAGEIYLEELAAEEMSLELGAGNAEMNRLVVSEKLKLDGGVGRTKITEAQINNLDLNVGVGEIVLDAKLTGKSKVDAGIGNIHIDLTDELENYRIEVDHGIGAVTVNGEAVATDTVYGTGESYLKIDGGIGAIKIE